MCAKIISNILVKIFACLCREHCFPGGDLQNIKNFTKSKNCEIRGTIQVFSTGTNLLDPMNPNSSNKLKNSVDCRINTHKDTGSRNFAFLRV